MRDLQYTKAIADHYGMKHVLFLEFEKLEHSIKRFAEHLKAIGVEVTVIEGVQYDDNREKLMEALKTIDSVVFESQFIYWEMFQRVGPVFMNLPRSLKVFGHHVIERKTLMMGLEDVFTVHELAAMARHEVYDVKNANNFEADLFQVTPEKFAVKKDMTRFQKQVDKLQREKELLLRSTPKENRRKLEIQMRDCFKTGRKVRILNCVGQGKEWSKLNYGDIVEEWDCLVMDPNPNRGVWVMGLTEPVKLLNDDGYMEWEYVEPDSIALGLEILSMCRQRASVGFLRTFIKWVNQVVPRMKNGSIEDNLWREITDFLDSCGTPRRGYRHLINDKLTQYAEAHKFFGDDRIIVHRHIEELVKRVEGRLAIIEVDRLTKEMKLNKLEA